MLSNRDLFQQMRNIAEQSHNARCYVCEGTVTSRSISPPSVKVMLQPYNIETGWIRIGTMYAGPGYGFLAVPPEGMTVKVIFDLGDINNGVVACCVYNDEDAPPTISDVDDVVLQHKSGAQIYITSDGEVKVSSASGKDVVFNDGTAKIARVGDNVQVDIGGTTYTGTITSGAPNVKA